MSEEKKSNVTRFRPRERSVQSPPTPSLEARLEEARARRAQVLAQRHSGGGLKTSRPWLLDGQPDDEDFDPAFEIAALSIDPPYPPEPEPQVAPAPAPDAPDERLAVAPPAPVADPPQRSLFVSVLRGISMGAVLVAVGAVSTLLLFPAPQSPAMVLPPVVTGVPVPDANPEMTAPLDWDPTILVIRSSDPTPRFRPADALTVATAETAPVPGTELPLSHRLDVSPTAEASMAKAGGVRVRIFTAEGADREATAGVERLLASYDLDVGATTPVAFTIPRNEVRYFTRSDRRTAQALARLLRASAVRYPLTAGSEGYVDVWIAGD